MEPKIAHNARSMAHTLEQGQPVWKKILWFLMRPRLWGEMVRKIIAKVRSKREGSSTGAYEARAITISEALMHVSGTAEHQSISQLYAGAFEYGYERVRSCPVTMGGAGSCDLIYAVCEHLKATRAIETGVAYGWSSLAFLLSLTKRRGMLASTDLSYPIEGAEQYVGCVVPVGLRSGWRLFSGSDRQTLTKAIDSLSQIDICHYDSDKSYKGRMWAYPKLWEALRPGGVFISDDVGDNMAFLDFCKIIEREPIVVVMPQARENKFLGLIVK